MENKIKFRLYCDGAFSSSRSQQGWAFALYQDDVLIKLKYDGLIGGTNNRAEMNACLEGLKFLKHNNITEPVIIFTDSMYLIGTLTKNWKKKKNTDMWPTLFELITPNITFQHVKGHAGDVGNSLCDTWAVFGSHLDGCDNDKAFRCVLPDINQKIAENQALFNF